MTDAQRRFEDARRKVCEEIIAPIADILGAAQVALSEANQRAERAEVRLEVLLAANPLRAAAPELLAALQDARAYIDGASPDWYYVKQEMLAQIDAAIAKARGQTEGE